MAKRKKKHKRPNLRHLENRPPPDATARLRARIKELEKALRPFAAIELKPGCTGTDVTCYAHNPTDQHRADFTVQDIIRARELVE